MSGINDSAYRCTFFSILDKVALDHGVKLILGLYHTQIKVVKLDFLIKNAPSEPKTAAGSKILFATNPRVKFPKILGLQHSKCGPVVTISDAARPAAARLEIKTGAAAADFQQERTVIQVFAVLGEGDDSLIRLKLFTGTAKCSFPAG